MQKRARICGSSVLLYGLGLLACVVQAQDNRPQDSNPPDKHLWHSLKDALTGSDGAKFFDQNVKDCKLPSLVGKVISATPAEQPSVLVLQMYDSDRPEVTLRLKDDKGADTHMPGPVMVGSFITFQGVAISFTKEPFMLTFDVDTTP